MLERSYIGSERISHYPDSTEEIKLKLQNAEQTIEDLQQEVRKLKIYSREQRHNKPKDQNIAIQAKMIEDLLTRTHNQPSLNNYNLEPLFIGKQFKSGDNIIDNKRAHTFEDKNDAPYMD